MKGRKAPRKRRSAEDARRQILDAAEKRLAEAGTGGIRLQQIAADVGVSHPAILHHFGSREGLIRAVVERAVQSLEADVIGAIQEARESGQPAVRDIMDRAFQVLVDKGHGRVVAWLLLSGVNPPAGEARVRTVSEVAHELRSVRAAPGAAPEFEDTLFRTLLVALVVFGEAVAGPAMRASAGLGDDPRAAGRFRDWLAALIGRAPGNP